MHVKIVSDYEEVSRAAADIVQSAVKNKSDVVLGLPTGSTPERFYQHIVNEYSENNLDFSGITSFNLDEYLGLEADHPQSYRCYMEAKLFSHVNIKPENTHIPDGLAEDIGACCSDYEEAIARAGGIDLQVLGIGRDGHIGFNEPVGSLKSRTRKVVLAPETIEDNARFFNSPDEVPRFAISMGLGTILDARSCLMLASGENKADAIRECIEGPVSASVPASVLQLHADTTVVIDEPAASKLENLEYYKWVDEAMGSDPLQSEL